MAEIVNLAQARKQAARAAARRQGDENAMKFGRTLAQKKREAQDASRAGSRLDGHRLQKDRAETDRD